MEWLFQAIIGVAATFATIYILGELFSRLPPKFEIKTGGYPGNRFAAWVDLVDFGVDEYRVGHVTEWELGFVIKTTCEGTVELDDKTTENRRVNITLYSFRDAYTRTNVIGWVDDKADNLHIRLSLSPDEVRDILNEMRLSVKLSLYVNGWRDEKGIKIEYFSLSPKLGDD